MPNKDFDTEGNLKPFPNAEEQEDLNNRAKRLTLYDKVPEDFWLNRRRPLEDFLKKKY